MVLYVDKVHKQVCLAHSVSKWQRLEFWARYTLEETPRARLLFFILNLFSAVMLPDVHGHHTLLGLCWMSWL